MKNNCALPQAARMGFLRDKSGFYKPLLSLKLPKMKLNNPFLPKKSIIQSTHSIFSSTVFIGIPIFELTKSTK
jgi:hypothetical protein